MRPPVLILTSVALFSVYTIFVFGPSVSFRFRDVEVTEDEPEQSLAARRLIIAPSTAICNKSLDFIVFVHMRTTAIDRRMEWRANYGVFKKKYKFNIIYTLGLSESESENKAILEESKEYKDILQGDFIDSYRNITHKQLMHLRYASANCSHIPIILKMDDDLVFNVKRMQTIARNITKVTDQSKIYSRGAKFWCYVWHKSVVQRSVRDKWSMPRRHVKEDFWPDFCSGIGYIYTQDTVIRILKAAETARWLWVDDVFITGYLRLNASVSIHDIKSFDLEMIHEKKQQFADGNITFSYTNRKWTNEYFWLANSRN